MDAQPQPLEDAQSRAVEQPADEPMRSFQLREHLRDLLDRQDYRQFRGRFGANDLIEPREVDVQHVAV